MRSLIAFLAAMSVAIPAPAFAVAKAGGGCTKVGATATIKAKKYICTKSGGKKVWVLAKKAAQPVVISLPKVPDYYEAYGVLAPQLRMLDQFVAQFESEVLYSSRTSILIAESPGNPWNQEFMKRVNTASDRIRWLDPAFENPIVMIGDSKAWLEEQLLQKCPRLLAPTLVSFAASGCSNHIAVYAPLAKTWDHRTTDFVPAHETFHTAQFDRSNNRNWNAVPSWFREGSVQLFGALSAAADENGLHYYDFIGTSPIDRKDCQVAFYAWSSRHNDLSQYLDPDFTNQCEYGLGRRMVAFLLYLAPNLPGLLSVYEDVGQGMTFNDAIYKRFGIHLSDYYPRVEAWLLESGW